MPSYAEVFKDPKGPGDARPTADQIVADQGLEGKWSDKVILITGCSSGIGIETAHALAKTGATLYLTARDISKAEFALRNLVKSPKVHLMTLDLESLDSVRKCAANFLSKSKKLNILIENAGAMATPEGRTEDGFETQFGTNHLSHFLLFVLLKPALLAASTPEFNSRVIILSSMAHRMSEVLFDNTNLEGIYHPWVAYGQSKTANIWTANQIEHLYGSHGLHAWSLHPGIINTGLGRHLPKEEFETLVTDESFAKLSKSPQQGAATSVWAATAKELEGTGGKFLEDCSISKPYDPATGQYGPGYAPFAYDKEKEAKLWSLSLKLVGEKEDA